MSGDLAAIKERHHEFACSCNGRRWTEDENWQQDDPRNPVERVRHDGLIPCGSCNLGGWDTPENEPAEPSCDEDNQDWPCDAAQLLALLADTPSVEPGGLREQYERFAGFVYGVAETEVRVYDGATPDASMTLARLVEEAQRLLARNPHIPERPAPFDDWTDKERDLGVHEAVAEVERRNRERFGTPEMLKALESLNALPTQASDSPEKT